MSDLRLAVERRVNDPLGRASLGAATRCMTWLDDGISYKLMSRLLNAWFPATLFNDRTVVDVYCPWASLGEGPYWTETRAKTLVLCCAASFVDREGSEKQKLVRAVKLYMWAFGDCRESDWQIARSGAFGIRRAREWLNQREPRRPALAN